MEKEVPGNNNAAFYNVLSEEQLFSVEFLDVAPSPLPVYAKSRLYPKKSYLPADHYNQ